MELPALTRLWAAWERFWFPAVDARAVAAMRISLGVLLIGSWVLLWPQLAPAARLIDAGLLHAHHTGWAESHSRAVVAGIGLHRAHAAGLVAIVAFTVGYRTRWANLLTALVLIGFWHRLPWIQNGGDRLLRIWTLYLLTCDSGAAWSVDAALRARRGAPPVTEVPGLVVRLVQLQLMVVYGATGVEKLLGGQPWLDGSAIYYAMSEGTFSRAPWLFDPVLQTRAGQAIAAALTWVTLGWEILFPALVVWRRTRGAALWAGVGLHVGIFFTMSVGIFGPASVWGYQAFAVDRWRSARR